MRVLLAVILLVAVVLSGCVRKKPATRPTTGSPRAGAPQTHALLAGEVTAVNPVGRFVVLSFPPDRMPVTDQLLNLYRHSAKVAEVKVTGPRRNNNIVADIVTGAPEVGDEARPD